MSNHFFDLENQYAGHVIGVDEVGRGPLAGPVIASAAYIDQATIPKELIVEIKDSKKLSLKKREFLYGALQPYIKWSIGIAEVEEIDQINVLQASLLAMTRAIKQFTFPLSAVLVDGTHKPNLPELNIETFIKGEEKSLSIATASIMAKVTRDRLMVRLAEQYPHYGWEKNAGYGTKEHKEGLQKHGVTRYHRKSYKPIQDIIAQNAK